MRVRWGACAGAPALVACVPVVVVAPALVLVFRLWLHPVLFC